MCGLLTDMAQNDRIDGIQEWAEEVVKQLNANDDKIALRLNDIEKRLLVLENQQLEKRVVALEKELGHLKKGLAIDISK